VVPEHVWKNHVQDLDTVKLATFPVVGYGPWVLTGYVPGQSVTMRANGDFCLGAPRFGTLIVQYYANPDAAVSALRSGQLDVVGNTLTATQYLALAGGSRHIARSASATARWTGVEINPGARTRSGTAFGDGNPALHDQRVRKAIALAINRSELAGRVLDGLGEPGGPYLPPAYTQWAWTPSTRQRYDPALAGRLLDAAGYRKGPDGTRLSLRLGIHSDLATDTQVAPYLVEWLGAVGIRLTVQAMSFAELNQALPRGAWDLLMDGWNTGADPSYLLSVQTCGALPSSQANAGSTDAFFCDPGYDRLYARQLTEFSRAARARTVADMQRILYDADVDVILYYPDTLSAVRADRVRDFMHGPRNAQGFYPAQNNFDDWRLAAPAPGGAGGNHGNALWTLTALTTGVVAGASALMLRRRATADERE
jgi:peptide/nickel transport system substrate-binding protein